MALARVELRIRVEILKIRIRLASTRLQENWTQPDKIIQIDILMIQNCFDIRDSALLKGLQLTDDVNREWS
mgnify:CR=1 FL=1